MRRTRALLRAITPEARAAMGGSGEMVIDRFPFRVGRESRESERDAPIGRRERRATLAAPNNDLYLLDPGRRKFVSREHFQIERAEDGSYALVDRESACGTTVGNRTVGGDRCGESCPLEPGNVIVPGTQASPYVFQFIVEDE